MRNLSAFKIIGAIGVERRAKGGALFHIISAGGHREAPLPMRLPVQYCCFYKQYRFSFLRLPPVMITDFVNQSVIPRTGSLSLMSYLH